MLNSSRSNVIWIVINTFLAATTQATTHWNQLNETSYVDSLVDCQTQLKKLQWQNTMWPKQNGKKPHFDEVFDEQELHHQTLLSLKKQHVLADVFGIEINSVLMQADIDRMSRNTKDADALKQIYQTLDNHPETVALCLSRPYLVSSLLNESYYSNEEIHHDLKNRATDELYEYLDTSMGLSADVVTREVTYLLSSDQAKHKSKYDLGATIELGPADFKRMFEKLNERPLLEESQSGFSYTKLTQKTDKAIHSQSLIWPKQSLESWMARLNLQDFPIALPSFKSSLVLTAIDSKATKKADYSSISNRWEPPKQPTARYAHSALWTGSEMIIWGGFDYELNNTGGIYSPASDSWEMITMENAPTGRFLHSAVWTGTEMLIWGGISNQVNNTGKRYNPLHKTWREMSAVNAPEVRNQHTTVWTGNEMIVWGGRLPENGSESANTGGIYDPVSDTWKTTSLSYSPLPRHFHTAVWTGEDMIVWGGMSRVNGVVTSYLDSGARYNPSTDSWVEIANNPITSRNNHGAIWADDVMMVYGGGGPGFDTRLHIYDPLDDTWQISEEINEPYSRKNYSMIWTGEELILWGGAICFDIPNNPGCNYTILNSGLRYNPVSDDWNGISTVQAPGRREDHTAVWTGVEMVVWGGQVDTFPLHHDDGGRYNPSEDSWTPITANTVTAIEARSSHSAVWTGNDLLVWGGRGKGTSYLDTGGLYSLATDRWVSITNNQAPSGRYEHTTIWTGSEMIVWGGSQWNTYEDTGGRYDPLNNIWLPTSLNNVPTARRFHTAVWNGEHMLVWGGSSAQGALNTGSSYDPTLDQWQAINSLDAPAGRFYHGAVWTDNEMVVWGGSLSGVISNEGGRYDPTTDSWRSMNTAGAPEARRHHQLIWFDGEVMVWGGLNQDSLNTGAKYNTMTDEWTTMTTANAPTARNYNSNIWTGKEMVIWGGLTNGNSDTGGSYNPSTDRWLPTDLEWVPQARTFHSATWTGSEMIVWGGWIGTRNLDTMGIYYPFVEGIFVDRFEPQ